MDSCDILIIGGGINGTAIAADAASRGLRVLLVEKEDLGSGTSSASSKLIHGGLRYLQYGELGLVRESLRERERLLRRRPHLVRPIELLIPVRAGDPVPPWKLQAGLFLYDRLAEESRLPRHRNLSRDEVLKREPDLEPAELRGGFLYPDAQIISPERLCVELAGEAAEAGAVIRTHSELVGLRCEAGRVIAELADDSRQTPDASEERRPAARNNVEDTDRSLPDGNGCLAAGDWRLTSDAVAAHLAINAAGPWVDRVRQRAGGKSRPLLGGTKGSHLVLCPPAAGPRGPLYATAKRDGRPFFILPWREMLLIGTTDIPYQGDPLQAVAEPQEVAYLLGETARLFPRAAFTPSAISYTYSGVRPLPASRAPAARITRRHLLVDHAAEGAPGLWSIVGGKLTTHRSLAEQVVDRAVGWLRREGVPAGARPRMAAEAADLATLRCRAMAAAAGLPLDPAQIEHLISLYGPRVDTVLARARQDRTLAERICPRNPDIAAQIVIAVEREWARTLADLLLRRTGIGSSPCLGLDCADRAAELMGQVAGWDATRRTREVENYRWLIQERYRAGLGSS